MSPYAQAIREAAVKYGIDPSVAMRVAGSEGLNSYVGDSGSSFGPFQLHYGGMASGGNAVSGLGDEFTAQTGLHASDPNTVPQQIDFALKHASQNGWGAWHGWKGDPRAGMAGGGAPTPISQAFGANTMAQAQPQQDTGSLLGRVLAGGPGALFGAPHGVFPGADGTPGGGYDLGGALQRAGAGLAMINDPAGGAAMMNAANMPLLRSRFSVMFDKLGRPMVTDTHTGKTKLMGGDGGGVTGQSPVAQAASEKALAENSQKEYAASQAAADQASQNLGLLDQAEKLVRNPDVSQGTLGSARNEAKKAAALIGIKLPGVNAGSSLDEITGQLKATQGKAIGMTRIAGPELKFLEDMNVSLNRPMETNLQAIANAKSIYQRVLAQHAARTAYMKTHGVLGPDFQAALDQANSANPTYPTVPGVATDHSTPSQRPPLSAFQH